MPTQLSKDMQDFKDTAAKFTEIKVAGVLGTVGEVSAVFNVVANCFKASIKSFNKPTVVFPNNKGSVAKSSLPKNILSA